VLIANLAVVLGVAAIGVAVVRARADHRPPSACEILAGRELSQLLGPAVGAPKPVVPAGNVTGTSGCRIGDPKGPSATTFVIAHETLANFESVRAVSPQLGISADIDGPGYRAFVLTPASAGVPRASSYTLFVLRNGTYVKVELLSVAPGAAARVARAVAAQLG
jgi:hypothetical protein